MRLARAVMLGSLLCLGAFSTRAADLSGTWALDQAQWEPQLDRLIDHMLAKIPPDVIAKMKAKGMDPATSFRAAASEGLGESIEFLPNGIVRTNSGEDEPDQDGHWTLKGNDLRITVDDAEDLEAMVGKVDGDRITLKPVFKSDAEDAALMKDMVFPLVRKH